MDIARTIRDIKAGRVEFRNENRAPLIHVPVGKVSFGEQQLLDNLGTLMESISAAKPSGAKGQYIRSVYLASTMSPGIRLDPAAAQTARAA